MGVFYGYDIMALEPDLLPWQKWFVKRRAVKISLLILQTSGNREQRDRPQLPEPLNY
jgi:hypothetical protein